MLDRNDVPSDWYNSGAYYSETEPNAEGLSHGFVAGRDEIMPYLNQVLMVYNDEQAAKQAFSSHVNLFDTHSDYWQELPELKYQSAAEQYRLACQSRNQAFAGGISCAALQRYGRYLSTLYFNGDGKRATIEHLEQILSRVDAKVTIIATETQTP